MSRRVEFRPEAFEELESSRDWYEARRIGLGGEFFACVEAAVEAARRSPSMFPYGIFFVEREDALLVLAALHASRDPAGWRQRR